MPKDWDPDKTPTATPNAKKSSGEWKLNLDSAPCARPECAHARKEHIRDGSGHVWECMMPGCTCDHFFIGGE